MVWSFQLKKNLFFPVHTLPLHIKYTIDIYVYVQIVFRLFFTWSSVFESRLDAFQTNTTLREYISQSEFSQHQLPAEYAINFYIDIGNTPYQATYTHNMQYTLIHIHKHIFIFTLFGKIGKMCLVLVYVFRPFSYDHFALLTSA